MSLLEIKKAGAAILKEHCLPVERVNGKVKKLLEDMTETMYEANGVGLAAPQVGIPLRVVVIDTGEGLHEMINPIIIKREGSEIDTEGCLSVPGMVGQVERAAIVTVEYKNRKGKKQRLQAEGLFGRCIQHELDHLEGTLFIDIAKSLKRSDG